MVTLTTTVTRSLTYDLSLTIPPEFKIDPCLDQLTDILSKYRSWDDRLSQRIFKWGLKVVTLDTKKNLLDQNLLNIIKRKITRLVERILVNPLDSAPLIEPFLERKWLWEKWQLNDYLSLGCTQSPFDGEVMEEPVPHKFAKSMFNWINTLPSEFLSIPYHYVSKKKSSPSIFKTTKNHLVRDLTIPISHSNPPLKMFIYCQMAKNFVNRIFVAEKLRSPMIEFSEKLTTIWENTLAKIKAETEKAELAAIIQERIVDKKISDLETPHHKIAEILHGRIDDGLKRIDVTEKKLQASEETCKAHEKSIRHLFALNVQREREINELKGQSSKNDSFCVIS